MLKARSSIYSQLGSCCSHGSQMVRWDYIPSSLSLKSSHCGSSTENGFSLSQVTSCLEHCLKFSRTSVFPSYIRTPVYFCRSPFHSPPSSTCSRDILISVLPASKQVLATRKKLVTTVGKVTSGPGVWEGAVAWSVK